MHTRLNRMVRVLTFVLGRIIRRLWWHKQKWSKMKPIDMTIHGEHTKSSAPCNCTSCQRKNILLQPAHICPSIVTEIIKWTQWCPTCRLQNASDMLEFLGSGKGNKKAKVLPDPVVEVSMTSLPSALRCYRGWAPTAPTHPQWWPPKSGASKSIQIRWLPGIQRAQPFSELWTDMMSGNARPCSLFGVSLSPLCWRTLWSQCS